MMYCKHCGTELAEGATFCPTCGKLVEDGQDPFATDVQVEYVDPFTDEIKVESVPPMDGAEKTSLASKLLKKAIVGLVMGVACFMMSTIFTDVLFSLEEFETGSGGLAGWGEITLSNWRFPWQRVFEVRMDMELEPLLEPHSHKSFLGIRYQ